MRASFVHCDFLIVSGNDSGDQSPAILRTAQESRPLEQEQVSTFDRLKRLASAQHCFIEEVDQYEN